MEPPPSPPHTYRNIHMQLPFSQKHSYFWFPLEHDWEKEGARARERERFEWRHEGQCHTSHTALGLTGTLRTWHSFQVGTKWRWHQAVSALQLIKKCCHSGS